MLVVPYLLRFHLLSRTVSIHVSGTVNVTSSFRQHQFSFVLDEFPAEEHASRKPEGIFGITTIRGDPLMSPYITVFGSIFARFLSSNVTKARIHHSDGSDVANVCGFASVLPCSPTTLISSNDGFEWTHSFGVKDSFGVKLSSAAFFGRNDTVFMNIHTSMHPSGELRGQLKFIVPVSPRVLQSFSINKTTGSAANAFLKPYGNFTVYREESNPFSPLITVYGAVFANFVSSQVIAVHMHGPASRNNDGPIVATICGNPSDVPCNHVSAVANTNVFEWSQFVSDSGIVLNKTLAQNGLYYLNIHTVENLAGELRGQTDLQCVGACSVPPFPSMTLLRPLYHSNTSSNCSFLRCSFPFFHPIPELFKDIVIYFSTNSSAFFRLSFNLTDQYLYEVSFDLFPISFSRGVTHFVQARLIGPFGASSLSPFYPFALPVVPSVEILEVSVDFESVVLMAAYSLGDIEIFEAVFMNERQLAHPSADGKIVFFFDTMNASIPRNIESHIHVRAILSTSPLLTSSFSSQNVSLPTLPIPNVTSVFQRSSSFTIVVESLPQNLPSAIGYNFLFASGEADNVVSEVFRSLDNQHTFDDEFLNFLRNLNVTSFVSLKTVFRQTSVSSKYSRPWTFSLLPPPASPSIFYELHVGQQNCLNLSWTSSDSDIKAFKISIPPVPDPFFFDGNVRQTSLCDVLVENTIYVASISSIADSGESPAAEVLVRYFMKPQLIFSSDPIPSIGLPTEQPSLQAVIYNFPVGLNSSSPGFGVFLKRNEHPAIHISAISVYVDAALQPDDPTLVSFRIPQLPDLCAAGVCSSYEVDLCFVAHGGLSVCSSLFIRSILTASILKVSRTSGPTKPKAFIDDIYVSIVQVDPLFLDGALHFDAIVNCVGASGHASSMIQFSPVDGTAVIRITPPPVNSATLMFFNIFLKNLITLDFVPRMNVSFAYESFDTPSLIEMFPSNAVIDVITVVAFQISSAVVLYANVSFGSKSALLLSISNSRDTGMSTLRAQVPMFSLREASSCTPPSPSCSSIVNATLSVILSDQSAHFFFRQFELLLPKQPQVTAIGSLIVDINNLATLNFSVSETKYLERVLIGNISCQYVIFPRSSAALVSVYIEANVFDLSSPNVIVFQSREDPDYFSVTPSFRITFRDFLQPSIESLSPSFGPLIGGTSIAIFTKEMSQRMFDSCTFFNSPCVIIEKFSNVSISGTMPITFSEHWSFQASSLLKSLISANPSSVSTLGVAIIRAPSPTPSFVGGNMDISFVLESKNASRSFLYYPNPSTPAQVSLVSPSEVSELGGRTIRIELSNLQVVLSPSSLDCLFVSSNAIGEVLDVKYVGSSATVVVLVPSILPGIVDGVIGPKSNIPNRGLFRLSVLPSVPFSVDPFSVSHSIVYQDFAGNISVQMTGVSPQASISSFSMLIRSFPLPRHQVHLITGASRSAISQLRFSIFGFVQDSRASFDCVCTVQYVGFSQSFNITVLPTVPSASIVSVSPTFGSTLGGSTVSVAALNFRELLPPLRPRFFINNADKTSDFTDVRVVSDKFSTFFSFVLPPTTDGINRVIIAHPIYSGSNVSFMLSSVRPVPRAEPLITSIRRGVNVTLRVLVHNLNNVSSMMIFTLPSDDYVASSTSASLVNSLIASPSSIMLTLVLPPAQPRSIVSRVSWIVRESAGSANFSFTLEASDVPSLASVTPASVSAYGGGQLTFIVTSFAYQVLFRDWTCSFPFTNVSVQYIERIDATSVRLQCVAPFNFQAISVSEKVDCSLLYNQATTFHKLPFILTFNAPPSPTMLFADNNARIMANSASVFVRNFAPFNSIDVMRLFIGTLRISIHSFIIRDSVLQLQFALSCTECNCCGGQISRITVSNTQFPMMSVSSSVEVIDPNAPAVLLVDPSVIPASGGIIVEIQVKNFPSTSSVATVAVGGAADSLAFQVVSAVGSSITSVRFFSPALSSGSVGYTIRADGNTVVAIPSSSPNAIIVSNLIISGQCSEVSLPAFGGVPVNCVVNNLPVPSVQGELEFRYTLSNTTVLHSSKNTQYVLANEKTVSVDLVLPNIADLIVQQVGIRLQILNTNFRSLVFSAPMNLLPSLPKVLFVDPSSSPNDMPVNVLAYVEYFSGSLFSVDALLDGVLLAQENYRTESISASVSAFHFFLPRAMRPGLHSVKFWSVDISKALTFQFAIIDVLQPKLIRIQPSQASTSGRDGVTISIMNFDFDQTSTLLLGSTNFESVGFFCQRDPHVCIISAIVPPSLAGVHNISLVTRGAEFILSGVFSTAQPVPILEFCVPTVGLISGGAQVVCYFLNIPSAVNLGVANMSSRFDSAVARITDNRYTGSVLAVSMTAPATPFEGNATITISIGVSTFSFLSYSYVRPCNFESFCSSLGLIPYDLKIIQQPVVDDSCSETYCLDPKDLPDPTIDLVSPSVVSTSGGSTVTMFCSNLLASAASDVFVSLVSPRSPVPVAAIVTSFDFVKNDVVFLAPSLPLEGPYSVVLSTRRSRQFVTGVKEVVTSLLYQTPIVGKAVITSVFPSSVPHNTASTLFVSLRNFVPVSAGDLNVAFSVNDVTGPSTCVVIFSTRSSTLVTFEVPAHSGPTFLNISVWNVVLARSRSADFLLKIEAPPVPAVISVFPDRVEAASDTVINLALANIFSSAIQFFVRTTNGTFVSNSSVVSVHDSVYLLQFSMPDSRIPGKPLLFDFKNALEVASASDSTFSAAFSLYVLAPSKPQIFISPRFTNLLTTEAPLATFVLTNFGGLPGTDAVSAVLSVDSSFTALSVINYKSDGTFGTVSVQFPTNIHAAKPAQVTIFPKSTGSESGATFSFFYVFPAPVVGPSWACTNGKSAGFVLLTAALPSGIDSQNFKISVNGATAQIVSVSILTMSSVNISLVFPASLVTGIVPVDIILSHSGSLSTFKSSVMYFPPPTLSRITVTEISTLNRALLPVQVFIKDFPSVASLRFSVTAPPHTVLIDSSEQSTFDSNDGAVITFFAPVGPTSGRLRFEVKCTDTSRFAPSVLQFLVVEFHITYQAPLPSILSVVPSTFDMSGGARITVTAQYLRVATSSQLIFFIGSRLCRNISVLYSDDDATSFSATVTSSDAPGIVQATLSHSLDSRVSSFSIRYTGRQTATCVRNCIGTASQGSVQPLQASLRFFPLMTRSNQLRCSISSLSACSVELVNSSSTTTFIEISIGPVRSSAVFQSGALSSTVTVSANDDSASFEYTFLRSPAMLSAEFLTETSFRVVFDQPIVIQGALNSTCDPFKNHLSLFGEGAICRLSRETLTVSGGSSFSMFPGDTVLLVPGLVFGIRQVADSLDFISNFASGDIAVMGPSRTQPPSVSFISQSSIGPCDDLELRIANPTPRARYSWICLNDDSVTAAAKARIVDSRVVRLRSSDMPKVNFGYKFLLSATSMFSRSENSSVFEVFKLSQAVPNIISSNQSSLITVPVIVTAQVEFSACPVKAADMVFEWTAGDVALNRLLKEFSSSTIMIPERTLSPGRTYVLQCSVFKSDDPIKKSVGTYTIETLVSQLQAFVTGGGRVASVQSEVVIDASASYDPDFSGPGIDSDLKFLWQCTMAQGLLKAACRDANGLLLNLTSSRSLSFPPDFLVAGTTYEFSVNVFKSGRSAVALAAVQIATGAFVEDATLVLASQRRVNADEKVSIICKSETTILSYQWSISEVGVANPLSVTNSDPTGQTLLILPGVLTPGKDYEVSSTVTAKNRQPTKLSLVFSVNSPPSSGICTVSPRDGVASVTAFSISCDRWVDVDGGLKYDVVMPDGAGKFSRYPLDMSRPVFLSPVGGRSNLEIEIIISDKFACETRFSLSVKLSLPPLLPASDVGNSCKSLAQLGKHLDYAQCIDSSFAAQGAASGNSSRVRSLLSISEARANITLMKAAVLSKVNAAADQAPLGVDSLSRSYLQTITSLCSGGDLGQLPSSLMSCVSLLSRTSQTLLAKPVPSGPSTNIVSTAAGILASFSSNRSTTASNTSMATNANISMLQIQQILNITSDAVFNSAKQAYLGDQPISFVTPFSTHVASRTTLASLNGTFAPSGMARISLGSNLASEILGSASRGAIEPINVIAEKYNSSVLWGGASKQFVSGVHGLSLYRDSGPIVVKNLPSNCSINISIPLDATNPQGSTLSNYKCNYWDAVALVWKQDGCRVVNMSQTHVTVSTSHLTQFGIEFQPSPPATSLAPPASTAPLATPPPSTPSPTVILSPPFSRLDAVLVTVSVSFPNFDRNSSVCRIIFADLTSVPSIIMFDSATSVKCIVPSSSFGRTLNISVSGFSNVSAAFTQFESYRFTSVQWDSSLDSFTIASNSSLPQVALFQCDRLFSASSVALLGTGPTCSMSNHSIKVSIGSGSRLRLQQLTLEPSDRFYKMSAPTQIFATTLPAITVPQYVPSPTTAIDGPTSFGSCSSISLRLIVKTPAKVSRAPELSPSIFWAFMSFKLHSNSSFINASSIASAFNKRLSNHSADQILFLANSWTAFNLRSQNLPPGEYTLNFQVLTWYQARVEGNVTFTVAIEDAPVLYPIRMPNTVYRNQISRFSANVALSACSANSAPTFLWLVRNWNRQLLFTQSEKTLTIAQSRLQLTSNRTFFVEFVVNGLYQVSESFVLAQLPPVALVTAGESITIGNLGGSISASASYDPNYGPNEQPQLAFLWSCATLDMSRIPTSGKVLNIPPISSPITCTVTVTSTSGLSAGTSVNVIPVQGEPPSLAISSAYRRVAANQNLAINVRVSFGVDAQYGFEWSATKALTAADSLTSLQSPSLVVKAAFFAGVTSDVKFTCRVTNKANSVSSETSITIGVNSPPACGSSIVNVASEECVGSISDVCPVTAMQSKLQIALHDSSSVISPCIDEDGPIKYQLLSFTTTCSASAKGLVLSTSALPSFSAIQLANGVRSVAIDAIDSLGASFRTCSQNINVNAVTQAALAGLFQSATLSSVGDTEAQKRLVANVAGSLASLYAASNGNTAALDVVKEQALTFLKNGASASLLNAEDAASVASSLHSLVLLPGSLSASQTTSAVSMFAQFSASSMVMLVSGAAPVAFAVEVSPLLVEGSHNVFGKLLLPTSSRRILAYKSGMEAAYSSIISAAKVQVFALSASQDAVVTEQASSLVSGIRRLRSASAMSSLIAQSALLSVAVSVSPDADASSVTDIGLVAVVQANSPFADTGSVLLISPTVALASFEASSGAPISTIRNVLEARFPVNKSSHDARVVVNAAGQRKTEGCVVYDGARWLPSCAIGPYTSASNSIICTCNMTASSLAVAAAEFIVDCSGTVGGVLVLDACKKCGGSVTDASKCSSEEASVNVGVIVGGVVGGCVVVALAFFVYFRKQQPSVTQRPGDFQTTSRPPTDTRIQPPEASQAKARPFLRKQTYNDQMQLPEANRDDSPERIIPGSPMKNTALSRTPSSGRSGALNQSATVERQPGVSPEGRSAERYKELLARQRELLDRHTGILAPHSSSESYDVVRSQRALYDSSAGTEALSAPAAADHDQEAERYRRVLMMRQRLSAVGATLVPSDSPALNLPALRPLPALNLPTSSGQYGNAVAERLKRLQNPRSDGE